MKQLTKVQALAFFKCTEEQLRNQYLRNSAALQKSANKARAANKKVNGYTSAELQKMADQSAAKANE